MKKKKFNWLGFIALLIWDYGLIQYLLWSMGMTNALLDMGSFGAGTKNFFSGYYIFLFIILVLVDLGICRDNKWMITISVANLIYYGVACHFDVAPISIIGCILVLAAGIYGLIKENKVKNSNN